MFELIGIPPQAFFGQLLLGVINGSFYAVLSLGLALIFGLLNVINFTHGAQYMLGAYVAWLSMSYAGVNYWWSLLIAPMVVGGFGILMERLFLRWLYKLDHLYGLLLTFGLALIIEGVFRQFFGISGQPYPIPPPTHRDAEPGLHVSSELPRMGGDGLPDHLPLHQAGDREDPSGRIPQGRHGEPDARAGFRH